LLLLGCMVLLLGPASAAAGCFSTGMSLFFTPSLYLPQFLLFKCILQALEGLEELRTVSQRLQCNWQMTSEFPFKDTSTTRTHCHQQV